MKICGVYKITCIINNKFYIGSSCNINKRFVQHKSALRRNYKLNDYLQNCWNKYGEDNFIFEIIEECSIDKLIEREQYFIDTLNPELNLNKRASSIKGYKWSNESKRKKSELHKKLCSDPNYVHPSKGKKTGKPSWNRGIPQTEETKEKLSIANSGKRRSIKTEIKPGQILCPDKCRKVMCIELDKIFDSLRDAGRFVGDPAKYANIRACCLGIQKTAYGYTWKFVYDKKYD